MFLPGLDDWITREPNLDDDDTCRHGVSWHDECVDCDEDRARRDRAPEDDYDAAFEAERERGDT